MEVLISHYTLCYVTLAMIFFLWFKLKRSSAYNKTKKFKLPPGPWNLPILGSLHHLVGAGLPHRAMLDLSQRHGPLMLLRLGEVPTVVVSSAEAAAEIMKVNDLAFATRPRSPTIDIVSCGGWGLIFAPYGEHWRQLRKVCIVELLSARQVQRMQSIRQTEVAHLIRSIAAFSSPGAAVNLSEMLRTLTNDVIATAVFGGKCEQQGTYLRLLDQIATLVGGFNLADLFPSSRLVRRLSSAERDTRKCYRRIQRILGDIIEERKAQLHRYKCSEDDNDADFLDVLLRLQREDSLSFPLTAEVIGAVIFDIFGAASETTATTLEWAMSELIRNPQAMARTQQEVRQALDHHRGGHLTAADLGELKYLKMVIKEVLRLHPAASMLLPRESREDCQIMGYDIPKGTSVFLNAFAISRDPRYWDDAEEFKPERFEHSNVDYKGTHFEFIPFGAGRRQCPGALFATANIGVTMAGLLYHFDWTLLDEASPEILDMDEVFGITVRRRSDLVVRAIPYVP